MAARHFKAVFLDVGGTLLRMGGAEIAYQEILASHGHHVTTDEISAALKAARAESLLLPGGRTEDHRIDAEREWARRDAMVRGMLSRLGVSARAEVCREAIWESWLGTRVFEAYPESIRVLQALKGSGYVLVAVSNWEPRLEALCANHGLASYFDHILASEAEGHVKPGPVLFQKALQLAQVTAAEAVHVGDSHVEDVQAAAAVGISAVLLARDGAPDHGYQPTIRTLDELPALLEGPSWPGCGYSGVGIS